MSTFRTISSKWISKWTCQNVVHFCGNYVNAGWHLFFFFLCVFSSTLSGSEKMFQGSKLANYSTTKQLPTQTNRQRLIHKAKMKSLRISVVIIIAFLICWTPYYVMMIIFLFWNPDKKVKRIIESECDSICLLGSLLCQETDNLKRVIISVGFPLRLAA